MADFTPVQEDVTVKQTSGNRWQKKSYPTVGNTVGVIYLEVAPANLAAAAAKFAELQALCVESSFKKWQAVAVAGKRPAVDARMLVIVDAEV